MNYLIGTLKYHFKEDISAAFGLALVVLPLSMGIAIASGVPPMAGVLSAIVGGLVATFFRSSSVTINGPSAGLIAVLLSGTVILGEGNMALGFQCLLAASVVAGILQMLMGLLKLGEMGDSIPVASIHGMLAAVGVIIFSTQIHVVLGVESNAAPGWESLNAIPSSLQNANPFIGAISAIAVLIFLLHHKIKNKVIESIPAPIWIILFTVPVVFFFNFFEPHTYRILGATHEVSPDYLVHIPANFLHSFTAPVFSKISTPSFWLIVFSITVVSSIETLISSKAVDKLDSLNRETNLSQELFAVGLSTSIAGMIGGLPVITAIPVYNGAKTKWANFYYGLFLLLFVFVGASVLRLIPLAALGVLLLYTAYKFSAPKIMVETYRKGDDQFLIFLTTLVAALSQGLLFGILFGILTTLFIHFVKSNLVLDNFFRYMTKPSIAVSKAEGTSELYIKLKGVINFINIPKLKRILRQLAEEKYIVLDMSHARLIDYTVLEYLHDDVERYDLKETKLEIIGLGAHDASSRHPNATRILPEDKKPQLNKRQEAIKLISEQYNGTFWPEIRWDLNLFKDFNFFKTRKIEYTINTAKGNYKMFMEWETCDITFEEGGLFAKERHTSVNLLHLPFDAPVFVLEREGLIEKLSVKLNLKHEDINFTDYPSFSDSYLLRGDNEKEIRAFFNDKLLDFLVQNPYYHVESNGTMILIFRKMRFESPSRIAEMHDFSLRLAEVLLENWKAQTLDLDVMLADL